jgi:hypothetical protein
VIGFSGIPVINPDFNTARIPSILQYKIRIRITKNGQGDFDLKWHILTGDRPLETNINHVFKAENVGVVLTIRCTWTVVIGYKDIVA